MKKISKKTTIKEHREKITYKDTTKLLKLVPNIPYCLELFKLKYWLLAINAVKDDKWLEKYINLLETNLKTAKIIYVTQEHHGLPLVLFSKAFCSLSNESAVKRDLGKLLFPENIIVNLSIADHIRAHYYLAKCAKKH